MSNAKHTVGPLLNFAEIVARSACLQQRIGSKCICFACEAQRAIDAQTPDCQELLAVNCDCKLSQSGGITYWNQCPLHKAAPELLEALKACVERMEELQKHTNYPLAWPRVQAKAAIEKAGGE